MKLTQMKAVATASAVVFIGVATYTAVHSATADAAQAAADLNRPAVVEASDFTPVGQPDRYRCVLLTGRIVYENGKPAGGIKVAAQCQNRWLMKWMASQQGPPGAAGSVTIPATVEQQEDSWNNAVSRSDGTYSLAVGANVPYNVMVFDDSGMWVAAAAEGVSGQKGASIKVPDLVLTKGAIVQGTVKTAFGLPVAGAGVASYDPHRPASSAAVDFVKADLMGHYRVPGLCRVYTDNGLILASQIIASQNVTVVPGEVAAVNLKSP